MKHKICSQSIGQSAAFLNYWAQQHKNWEKSFSRKPSSRLGQDVYIIKACLGSTRKRDVCRREKLHRLKLLRFSAIRCTKSRPFQGDWYWNNNGIEVCRLVKVFCQLPATGYLLLQVEVEPIHEEWRFCTEVRYKWEERYL